MFQLDYRVVHSEYDDFVGESGFFQINCNGFKYGEMYSEEVENVVEKMALYDWFESLVRVLKNLMTKEYVVLSDVESYNTWIEFKKEDKNLIISVVKAVKEPGSHDIEFLLENIEPGSWGNQIVDFQEFKRETLEKTRDYLKNIEGDNPENILLSQLGQMIKELY